MKIKKVMTGDDWRALAAGMDKKEALLVRRGKDRFQAQRDTEVSMRLAMESYFGMLGFSPVGRAELWDHVWEIAHADGWGYISQVYGELVEIIKKLNTPESVCTGARRAV